MLIFLLVTPLSVSAAPVSGHLTIGMTTNPDRPVVTEETRLVITLRGNDGQSVADSAIRVRAEMAMAQTGTSGMHHGNAGIDVTAKPSGAPGEYLATLKLPDEGVWKITIASGDSAAEFKVTANRPLVKEGQRAATSPSSVPVRQSASTGGESSMEAIHASYLDLSANISDLRARVAQWQKGDEDSLKIAEEKIERIEVVLGSITWPQAMAVAIGKTEIAVGPMAKALKSKDLAAAEVAAKEFGDASHDVTHSFYGDWLPSLEGIRFSPMAPHAIHLDITGNISDLGDRVAQWQKGDEGSLNIAKEKAERIGVLLPHMSSTGVLLKPLKAIEKFLPTVVTALEKKDASAAQGALAPVADASRDLTRDFHIWMDIAGGTHDAACAQASYLDLSRNMSVLRSRVAEWQKGDEGSLKSAQEQLGRLELVLAHPVWPAEMAAAIDKTNIALASMAKALNDKNVAASETASKALGDASHDVTHAFYADWLPGVDLGSDAAQVGSAQGKPAGGAHVNSHGGPSAVPNYWFSGSIVGIVLITIVLVPALRRRDLVAQRVEVD